MGIRNSENMEDRAHNAQFTEEKFTLQDVFSWDGYFGLKEKGISMPYKISDRDPEHSQFDLFEKSSQRYINSSSYVGFMYDKVNKNLNNDKIHEDEIMIVSANGLNVMPYRFFGHFSLRNKNLKGFGFDREDSFFQDYLKKATELLRNLNNENDSEENHIPATTTHNAERIHKLYSNGIFTNVFGLMDASHEKIDFKELPAKDLVMKYGGALNSKDAGDMYYDIDNLNLNIPFNDRYDYKRRSNEYVGNFGKGKDLDYFRDLNPGIRSSTPSIPVFVNSNDVPQLKWGHASYASFWTNNAFNFLKIKHTDHLPKHEETAE
jgi:hypothetical protein